MVEVMEFKYLRVVINCLFVFEMLSKKKNVLIIYLVGGEMWFLIKFFFGEIVNKVLEEMYFYKVFFSCNVLKDNKIMIVIIEEG